MRRIFSALALAAILGSGAAFAGADYCNVPKDEWQPQEVLEEKLKGEGWTIKRVKIDAGCYEVYGKTADGKRMEAYFDPKSFELVKSEGED
jgi:hypothetical protein